MKLINLNSSKQDLIEYVAEAANMSKAEAGRALDAVLAGIQKGEFNIRQTFSYRIGKLILKPFVVIKRIFQNYSKS